MSKLTAALLAAVGVTCMCGAALSMRNRAFVLESEVILPLICDQGMHPARLLAAVTGGILNAETSQPADGDSEESLWRILRGNAWFGCHAEGRALSRDVRQGS